MQQHSRQLLYPVGQLYLQPVRVSRENFAYMQNHTSAQGMNDRARMLIPELVAAAVNACSSSVQKNHARTYQWNVISRSNFNNTDFEELVRIVIELLKLYYLRRNASEAQIATIPGQASEWHCGVLAWFTPALLQTLPPDLQAHCQAAVHGVQSLMSEIQQRINAETGSQGMHQSAVATGQGMAFDQGQVRQKQIKDLPTELDPDTMTTGYARQAAELRRRQQSAMAVPVAPKQQKVNVFVNPNCPYVPLVDPRRHAVEKSSFAVPDANNAIYNNYTVVPLTQTQREIMDRALHESATGYNSYQAETSPAYPNRESALTTSMSSIVKATQAIQVADKTQELNDTIEQLSLFRSVGKPLMCDALAKAMADVQVEHKLSLQENYYGTAYLADVILSKPFVCLNDYSIWLTHASKCTTGIAGLANAMRAAMALKADRGGSQDFRNFLIGLDRHLTRKLNWAFRHLFSLPNFSIDSVMHDAADVQSALMTNHGSFVLTKYKEYEHDFIKKFLAFSVEEVIRREDENDPEPSVVQIHTQDMLCTMTNIDVTMAGLNFDLPSGQVRQIIESNHPQLYKFAREIINSVSPEGKWYTHHILVTADDHTLEVARGALNSEAIVIAHARF